MVNSTPHSNTYHSAISATHPPVEVYPVGQHPIVCRMNSPSTKVPEFLKSMAPNEAILYKDLTMKLVALMAVTNANPGSDLQALDRMFIQKTLEGMLFSVPGLTKTRRSRGPKEVRYPKFVFDARICPVNIVTIFENHRSTVPSWTRNNPCL